MTSLRNELLRMLLSLMLPLVVLWAWYLHGEFEESKHKALGQMDQAVQSVAQLLEQSLQDYKHLITAVATEFEGDSPVANARFNPDQFARIHSPALVYGVHDLQGRLVYSSSPTHMPAQDVLQTAWGRAGVQSERFAVHGAFLTPYSKRWVAMLTHPVRNRQGVRTGFVYFALDLMEFNQRMLAWAPQAWVIPVFDQNDRFLLRSVDPAQWIGQSLPETNAAMVRGKVREQFEAPDIHGTPRLYAVATVPSAGWRVFAGIPTALALQSTSDAWRWSLWIGALVVLSVMALGVWRARRIAEPWRALAQHIPTLAHTPGARLSTGGLQEVHAVAHSFNGLLDALDRAAQDRKALADHYATLLKNARDIVLLFDDQGRIVDANLAAEAAYGYASHALRGKTAAQLRAPHAAASTERDWHNADSADGALFETVHVRADGSEFPVEVSSSVLEIEGQRYRQSFVRDITQRKEAQQSEQQAAQLAQETLDALNLCVGVLDSGGHLRMCNQHWRHYAQEHLCAWMVPPLAVGQSYVQALRQTPSPGLEPWVQGLETVLQGHQAACTLELMFSTATGQARWVLATAQRFQAGSGNLVLVLEDLTERKQLEQSLTRQARALRARSSVDHAIVTATSLEELLGTVCTAMVELAGYQMVWVAHKVDDERHSVRPLASAGDRQGYLQHIDITWDDASTGRGPTGTALRTGEPVVVRDMAQDPRFAPWRAQAQQHGFQASAALPLCIGPHAWGALNLYAADAAAFDSDELLLLQELSANLAYGIDKLLMHSNTAVLQGKVEATEAQMRLLIEHAPVGMFALRHGTFVYANPRMEDIMGYGHGELEGVPSRTLIVEQDWPLLMKGMRDLASTGTSGHLTVRANKRDGSVVQLGLQDVRAEFEGETAIIGMAQDIGERLRAQEEIQRYVGLLEQTTESTLRAVAAMVEQRDPYTAGHERRVGDLAAAIGGEMGLTSHQVQGLRLTGVVHDIGKIAVPAELLSKPTRLTEIEMALIRQHSQTGYDVLKDVQFAWPVADVILQHHERLDGTGYPQGLRGDAILLEARIMMVADVVESMASHRPYRPSLGLEAALAEITQYRGIRYDPAVVDACLRLFREKAYQLPK